VFVLVCSKLQHRNAGNALPFLLDKAIQSCDQMQKALHLILCALAVVISAGASSSTNTCGDEGCDASPVYDVGAELVRLADNVPNVSLLQRKALYYLGEEDAEDIEDTETDGTTTTTTQATASKEETCNSGVSLVFDTLVENTFGQDNGRLLFKNVAGHEGQSLDLIITDAAANYPAAGFDAFGPDERGYTGVIKTAARIAVDEAGKYMLRFKLADSTTGDDAKLPLFPFVFYDLDGSGEAVMACNVAGVITHEDTTLTEKFDDPCYHHLSPSKEVNLPRDFESLTLNQKKQSVTYVYRNTGVWDIGFNVHQGMGNRYILFKGSKVLACDSEDATSDKPWKNKGKSAGDA